MNYTIFHPERAEINEDGSISMPTGGFGTDGIWDGWMSISQDSTEYQFWIWAIAQKSRWNADAPESWITSRNIAQIKQDYAESIS